MTARDRTFVEVFGERSVDEEDATRFGDEGGRPLDLPRPPKSKDRDRDDARGRATSNS